MTRENCENLLKHFESIVDGTFPKTPDHKDWAFVVSNAKVRAKECKARLARYELKNPTPKPVIKETKIKEEKKDGKKST